MIFGRGQWAVFGVEAGTLDNFQAAIADPLTAFGVSQLAASIITKFQNKPQTGINPFGAPRLDEKLTDAAVLKQLSDVLVKIEGGDSAMVDRSLIDENLGYIGFNESFALGNSKFAFWFVQNEYEDVSDPNSKKEQVSYDEVERPFKFLGKEEKKAVEDRVAAAAVLNRSQFPVLVDFQHERVYAASSNVDAVNAVKEVLSTLGAKPFSLVWDFGDYTWPSDFLNRVKANNFYTDAFKERADELSRFKADEVEKHEDKQLERIVSTYFSLSQLESDLWCGLTTPARIRIHKPIDPVSVSHPSVAFSLLNMSNDAEIATASVVFQELVSKFNKAGEEKQYRNDLFTVDINDNLNIQEAGAALLRGFDMPQFKKTVKTTLKAKGRIDVKDFWYMWIDGLHNAILEFIANVTDVLEVSKANHGLKVQEFSGTDEVQEE